jgi:hypothetical protein
MNIGMVITMYDECDVVLESIKNMKNSKHNTTVILIHSDNKETRSLLNEVIEIVDSYKVLPNLSGLYDKFELPSAVVCRNYSVGFTELFEFDKYYDFVIGITADTLIIDLDKLLDGLSKTSYNGYVLQAIGQSFHDKNDDPKNGKSGGRYQHENITDIMPQFFMFKGDLVKKCKMFTNIENVNTFTSEQCLGDEISKHINNFKSDIKRINKTNYAYSYDNGIKLQVKGLGHTREI